MTITEGMWPSNSYSQPGAAAAAARVLLEARVVPGRVNLSRGTLFVSFCVGYLFATHGAYTYSKQKRRRTSYCIGCRYGIIWRRMYEIR